MRVFLDSNILLESLFQERRYRDEARRIICAIRSRKHKGYISVGSFYTIIYYTERYLKKQGLSKDAKTQKLREYLSTLLDFITVIPQENKELEKGVMDSCFYDLEDSCQYQAALKSKCDYLVTINTNDFIDCKGKTTVIHPEKFVKILDE